MDYEAVDKAALYNALLALHVCPNKRCGRPDLQPVALSEDTWGCAQCHETWYLPDRTNQDPTRYADHIKNGAGWKGPIKPL